MALLQFPVRFCQVELRTASTGAFIGLSLPDPRPSLGTTISCFHSHERRASRVEERVGTAPSLLLSRHVRFINFVAKPLPTPLLTEYVYQVHIPRPTQSQGVNHLRKPVGISALSSNARHHRLQTCVGYCITLLHPARSGDHIASPGARIGRLDMQALRHRQ